MTLPSEARRFQSRQLRIHVKLLFDGIPGTNPDVHVPFVESAWMLYVIEFIIMTIEFTLLF